MKRIDFAVRLEEIALQIKRNSPEGWEDWPQGEIVDYDASIDSLGDLLSEAIEATIEKAPDRYAQTGE